MHFQRKNFKHLTGVETEYFSNEFYKLLLKNKIDIKKISKRKDGTTNLKLSVLPLMVKAEETIRYVGVAPDQRVNLYSEMYLGTEYYCVGAVQSGKYYAPSTLLKSGVKDETLIFYHVQSIYVKGISQKVYTQQTYKNKRYDKSKIKDERLKALLGDDKE